MAKHDHIKPHERYLTVSLWYTQARFNLPCIRLGGIWLKQAGFLPKSRIKVRVMNGCIVITKKPDQESKQYDCLQKIQKTLKNLNKEN